MQTKYEPKAFENKIYENWQDKKLFAAKVNKDKKPFAIFMPPPNITGQLHMGHALNNSIQDALVRYKRMKGFEALWLPGTDHASIATEVKIIEKLKQEGKDKRELGREGFLKEAFLWNDKFGGRIVEQLKVLGCSCDWDRKAFTMDENCSRAVREVFVRLFEKGLIYRGERIINWCVECKTALSDAEVEHEEKDSGLWTLRYPIEDENGNIDTKTISVATTRPETMLGDAAVAVNPKDKRYAKLIGKFVILPLLNRRIPIIADDYVDASFGTGAVKITPAHDPNDFEVGARHNLPRIVVMDEGGVMNENAGEYKGLERYAARKKILADLDASELLEKSESRKNNVGHCYRCKTVVEPRVSKQWFVKMEPLAKPATKVVEKGEVKFIPKRFEKIYMHWMKNVRDWCISRQLWWGHRIPAFYCDKCGFMEVAREDLSQCSKCGGTLKQDEDVLDTWFSSALWPFSTLGWPNESSDLDYFYPSDVLVTAYDIIFFWVARMIFSGIEQMGEKPFSSVYIHGLVRDEQGRKMAKSLGNGIDPLEIIEQFGTDTLRFSLLSGVAPGGDQRFILSKVEANRNFMNKVFNAARFVLANCEGVKVEKIENLKGLSLADGWILHSLNEVITKVTKSMDKFEVGHAASTLYDFTWNIFCDWYIEFAKVEINSGDEKRKHNACNVLLFVLRETLKMLHPIIPFITEEIYLNLPNKDADSIMTSNFPKKGKAYKKSFESVNHVMELIRAIRNLRTEKNVSQSKRTALYIVPHEGFSKEIKAAGDYISKLANGTGVYLEKPTEKTVELLTPFATVYFLANEISNTAEEKARIEKELKFVDSELQLAQRKLSNPGFVAKAPKQLLDAENEKVKKFSDLKTKLEESLKSL